MIFRTAPILPLWQSWGSCALAVNLIEAEEQNDIIGNLLRLEDSLDAALFSVK
jgi:hypothetical protein